MKSHFEKLVKENLSEKLNNDDEFAQRFYASLCNTIWYNPGLDEEYSCTWRYAGGMVAGIRNNGEDYLNWYCTGGEGHEYEDVTEELNKLGYIRKEYDDGE